MTFNEICETCSEESKLELDHPLTDVEVEDIKTRLSSFSTLGGCRYGTHQDNRYLFMPLFYIMW